MRLRWWWTAGILAVGGGFGMLALTDHHGPVLRSAIVVGAGLVVGFAIGVAIDPWVHGERAVRGSPRALAVVTVVASTVGGLAGRSFEGAGIGTVVAVLGGLVGAFAWRSPKLRDDGWE